MSKIQNALKRAEEHRASKTQAGGLPPHEALTPEGLDDEVRRLEALISAWRVRPADPVPASVSVGPARTSAASVGGPWVEELQRCQAVLAACDERLTRAQQQRASIQAQVAEQERVVAQAAAHLAALQQRFQAAEADVQQVTEERTAHGERISILQQCQVLAQAAAETEQRLQVNTEMVAEITLVQQRVTDKLSQHQRASQELRESAETLRQQLADMLKRAQLASDQDINGGGRHE